MVNFPSPSTSYLLKLMAHGGPRGSPLQLQGKHLSLVPHSSLARRMVHNQPLVLGGSNRYVLPTWSFAQQFAIRRSMSQIAEEGSGTHKPSTFQKKILVYAKMYPSVDKVPERVTRTQLKTAMDKFRIRASLFMVAGTFIAAAIFALIGRKERQEGKSVTKMSIERSQS